MSQNNTKSNSLDSVDAPLNCTGLDLTTAPLANVSLCMKAIKRALVRSAHLPGMVCLYGPSGWGKSTAAAYTANRLNSYYIECKSSWTRKAVLLAILKDMGILPKKTIYEMAEQVCEQLVASQRPLIIDEMDYMVSKGTVEIIRDLYEGSGTAILLIGEERLPNKLKKWERFHCRILDWIPAQPAVQEDCLHLAHLYCRKVTISDGLLKQIHKLSRGSVRRICVNLELVQEEAVSMGLESIGLKDWGKRNFFTGEAPVRRV